MSTQAPIDHSLIDRLAVASDTLFGRLVHAANVRNALEKTARGSDEHAQAVREHKSAFFAWLDQPLASQFDDLRCYTRLLLSRLDCTSASLMDALPENLAPANAMPVERELFHCDLAQVKLLLERHAFPKNTPAVPPLNGQAGLRVTRQVS